MHTYLQFAVSPERKLARSSLDIHSNEPVTDEDLDSILKELAAVKEIEVADSTQPRTSTPPPEDVVPLSEIVGTLQRGFHMGDEDLTGEGGGVALQDPTTV